jgi:hypothetical protein
MPYSISTGETPQQYMSRLSRLTSVTEGDGISAASLSNDIIINNTVSGVDYRGNGFTPYSPKSPYYHSPASTGRNHKYRMETALHFSRYYGGVRGRGSTTVKFENYAAYVLAVRGSDVVDLGGREGRVLNQIESRSGSLTATGAEALNWPLESNMEPVNQFTQGIYSEPNATIASAHNYGLGRVPQREFFNETELTSERVTDHIRDRIAQRVVILNGPNGTNGS